MRAKKEIEYFMNLPYRIELLRIPEEKGGGYMACLPQFGRMAAVGDGETIEEALSSLEDSKRALFEDYIEEGLEIPQPDTEEEEYSGKFVVRVPKFLHRELSLQAKRNNASLNHFVTSLLAIGLQGNRFSSALNSFESEIELLRKHICELSYKMEPKLVLNRKFQVFQADEADDLKAA